MPNIIVVAKDFQDAAKVQDLENALIAKGVRIISRLEGTGIFCGKYDGDIGEIRAIDNVEDARPERIMRAFSP